MSIFITLKNRFLLWFRGEHSFDRQWRIGKIGMMIQCIFTIAVIILAQLSHRKQGETRELILQSNAFAIQAQNIHAASQDVRYEQLRVLQDYQRNGIRELNDNAIQRTKQLKSLQLLQVQIKSLESSVSKVISATGEGNLILKETGGDTTILETSRSLSRKLERFIRLDEEFIAKLRSTQPEALDFQFRLYQEIQKAGVELDAITLTLSKKSSEQSDKLTNNIEFQATTLYIFIVLFSLMALFWNAALLYFLSRSMKSNLGLVKRISKLANSDPLTGLLNRRAFNMAFKSVTTSPNMTVQNNRRVHTSGRDNPSGSACLMLIDLDHFKKFNDTYGHVKGDEHLKTCSAMWREKVRSQDFVSRMGGEEFAILMPECDELHAYITAERLQKHMPKGTSFSAGIALWLPGETFTHWYKRADRALYLAKEQGRSQAVLYSQIAKENLLQSLEKSETQMGTVNATGTISDTVQKVAADNFLLTQILQ